MESIRELYTFKKTKFSDTIKRHTYPSPKKLTKIELKCKINFNVTKDKKSKNTCNEKNRSGLINSNTLKTKLSTKSIKY